MEVVRALLRRFFELLTALLTPLPLDIAVDNLLVLNLDDPYTPLPTLNYPWIAVFSPKYAKV